MEAPKTNHRANTDGNNSIDFFLDSLSNLKIQRKHHLPKAQIRASLFRH